ncbi:hypothetical protein N7492_003288 [Penicillium capsulatum]|uniref:Uncharacterized protein n=1 Tax=Penicillium capsulatum TaxID=69766 RepID=A0A9W9IL15_9EURO|nr:hypothetical protein N7492_003288 [Penicillium capsulatum]
MEVGFIGPAAFVAERALNHGTQFGGTASLYHKQGTVPLEHLPKAFCALGCCFEAHAKSSLLV